MSDFYEILKRDEGVVDRAYPDPLSPLAKALRLKPERRPEGWQKLSGAPWTIGVGHTGPEVHPGTVWSDGQIDATLRADVANHDADLFKALPWAAKLDDVRRDVLRNMAFNLGVPGLLGFKNTLAFVHDGQFDKAADGMLSSKWAKQVGGRADRLAQEMRSGHRG